MTDLITHITDLSIDFNPSILEIDNVTLASENFNVYNNTKEQPYHKFWFMLDNLKFINLFCQKNYNYIRFAINNKTEKNMKFIKYFNDILEFLKNKLKPQFPDIIINYPWKENEYPFTILFLSNITTIISDSDNTLLTNCELDPDSNYSMIFEIAGMSITKDIVNNVLKHNLKYKLFIKILKKEKPINFLLFNKNMFNEISNINTHSNNNINNNNNNNNNYFNNNQQNENKISEAPIFVQQPKQIVSTIAKPSICFDPKTLLNIKNSLKKITNFEPSEKANNDAIKKDFSDTKNNLKNVKIEEKSLLTHLVKEAKENKDKKDDIEQNVEQEVLKIKKIKKKKPTE